MDHARIVSDGITFDDVLLIPDQTDFVPDEADTHTKLTRGIDIVEGGDETGVRRRSAGTSDGHAKLLKLVGIMTRRDLKFQEDDNRRIGDVMTREGLVTAPEETTLDEAERILYRAKVEKLL